MKQIMQGDKMLVLGLLLLLILLPLVVDSAYTLHVFVLTFMWAGMASGLNVLTGFGGQLSIGHAAYFGLGAYTASLLYVNFGLTPWIGMFAGGVVSLLAAGLISWPALRLKGPFFVLTTISFAMIIQIVARHFRGLTGGSVGLSNPFVPGFINMAFREREYYYYIFLVFMLIAAFVGYKIQTSKTGYYLFGLKGDLDAAESLGVPTTRYKLFAMLVSAFIVSIAGSLYAFYLFYIDPHTVLFILISVQMVLIVALGGIGTWQGPLLGAFIVVPLGEYLRAQLGGAYRGLHEALLGLIIILVVVFIPHGVFPTLRDVTKNLAARFFSGRNKSAELEKKEV